MPRPRKNVPLGLDQPHTLVTDPDKVARKVAEFQHRLRHAQWHYKTRVSLANVVPFNESLRELRNEIANDPEATTGTSLHVDIIAALCAVAHDRAQKRGQGERITDGDRRDARRFVADRLKPQQGQRRNMALTNFVEGMMALLQEMTGRPVAAGYHTKSVYDPQARDWMGKLIIDTARAITPEVTPTRIVGLIVAAQKKYAGKPMSFRHFYPGYGLVVTPI